MDSAMIAGAEAAIWRPHEVRFFPRPARAPTGCRIPTPDEWTRLDFTDGGRCEYRLQPTRGCGTGRDTVREDLVGTSPR